MKQKLILFFFLFHYYIFAQNVIIVVIDGARYTETFGSGNTYIPHMYDVMRPLGTLYTNFRIADEGQTVTCPGLASILTGTWQQIPDDGSQRPTMPTLYEYFRKELGCSIIDNYIIAGKSKLDCDSYSTYSGYGSVYGATSSCVNESDNLVYENLINIMDSNHPQLILVNLPDVDVAGHTGVWADYVNAIRNAESLVYLLWTKIQSDSYYQNTTTLFVTNDHGRHTTDFSSHGDDCDGCEHIMLFVIGRNVKTGNEISDLHYQIDIAPTIGNLLNFNTPEAIGTSLYEGSNPLPVELTSLTAETKGSAVELTWTTTTEVNNYEFNVERRTINSQQPAMNDQQWSKVGIVLGNGTSNTSHYFSFTDKKLTSGRYAYRLKQIDNGGVFKYSQSVEIEMTVQKLFVLSQNYPNPFNPITNISYLLPVTGNVTLKIYDILGKEAAVIMNETEEAGSYEVKFDASKLASGVYFYRLTAGNFTAVKKLVLMK